MIVNDIVIRKLQRMEVIVAKFEAIYPYRREGTEEYREKHWTRGRYFSLKNGAKLNTDTQRSWKEFSAVDGDG
jgi:hypothetical protein